MREATFEIDLISQDDLTGRCVKIQPFVNGKPHPLTFHSYEGATTMKLLKERKSGGPYMLDADFSKLEALVEAHMKGEKDETVRP